MDNSAQNIENPHDTDSLDLIFHPEKASKREQDMEAARRLSRKEDPQTCRLALHIQNISNEMKIENFIISQVDNFDFPRPQRHVQEDGHGQELPVSLRVTLVLSAPLL